MACSVHNTRSRSTDQYTRDPKREVQVLRSEQGGGSPVLPAVGSADHCSKLPAWRILVGGMAMQPLQTGKGEELQTKLILQYHLRGCRRKRRRSLLTGFTLSCARGAIRDGTETTETWRDDSLLVKMALFRRITTLQMRLETHATDELGPLIYRHTARCF
jgi:hypothetical protein